MRQYKIFKTDLGFWIYKKIERENWLISIRFLDWKDKRTLSKDHARTFYHREDAEWALIIMKHKDAKETD